MPQRDENNFFLVCLETAILPRIMISSSRPLVTADPSSHHCHLQTSLTPGTRQGSLWPHLVMKNQNCQPELLHMQWQCTGSLMGTSCHVCKTAGTGCSSQVFTAPPHQKHLNLSFWWQTAKIQHLHPKSLSQVVLVGTIRHCKIGFLTLG